ncbi:hypothetical protein LZK73_08265 [Neorhizobium galegae]|nr:hypothetical protein LZK73_08265 [Neorhizobium galegae]
MQPIAERLIASITDNLVFAASDGTSGIGLSVGAALTADAFFTAGTAAASRHGA